MGICLIAVATQMEWIIVILQVALGLGAVIFVHELGHFAVAKMCGVKCEKFFIGFDIGGYKLSHKWGETEYGIGILPLGGYVKMLGQDDNPANIAEQVRESQVREGSNIQTKEIVGPDGTKYEVDSRSYLAKSVPQRMAIISAGVIMNVIFAFIFAVIAYGIGVPYIPCIVGQTSPGSAAYQAGIRTGDEITRIGNVENPSFTDLKSGVTLGDLEKGIPFTVLRASTGKEEDIILKPRQDSGLPKVGIIAPFSLRLNEEMPVAKGSPAAEATPKFQGNDEIVAINGQPITEYYQLVSALVEQAAEPLEVTVQRGGKAPKDNPFGPRTGGTTETITVAPLPTHSLGLVMEPGKIVAVEQGSEAAAKKIAPGDFIDKISYAPGAAASEVVEGDRLFGDPMMLPEQLRKLALEGRTIELTVRHSAAASDGKQTTEPVELRLRNVTWVEPSWLDNDPLSVPALGIAYRVLNRVDHVIPDSPAAAAGMQSGDVVTEAEFTIAGMKEPKPIIIKFNEKGGHNWPKFTYLLQSLSTNDEVKLTYQRGTETLTAMLKPQIVPDSFEPERGFNVVEVQRIRRASSFGEQIKLGYRETVNSLGMVYRFLRKLGTQVPLTSLGGPITIAKAAGYSAFEGVGALLVFLTMLSANLAVINFLPIPLLDGGHMVFLAWEGIRGRPASERFVVALHTVGFVFIISLMLFVISLDFGWIDRNL
ncbi:M50 family metallopeptidase [Bythopirellula polymerisocia]|uniref:Regulator of sigma-E protease RseP n=1 Tax=Bythopirellula polymerisocia TaxID=2528003 RepID=A0A5C6CXH5_9BACT|nr:M50 family metallopeptidase [Bythopirellula polymerisocia]TWU29302.1 Regulator of sigma-E protease RseP [Bythopirellula polymerisocia]